MCGRYTLTSPDELVEEFGIGELPFELSPRYNIAPSQLVPVIVRDHAAPEYRLLRWGLVPGWVTLGKSTKRPINARSETVHEKPSFKDAFEHRRCLVCADGFYEWKREGARRLPFHMHRKDRRPISLAGIWDRNRANDGTELQTFAILTTDANDLMAPVHHRMPVIIAPKDRARWLDPAIEDREKLEPLLHPPDTEIYEISQVSEKVNSVANDSPACLNPGPDQQSLF